MSSGSRIDRRELRELAVALPPVVQGHPRPDFVAGAQPEVRIVDIEGDEYLFGSRRYRSRNRRGEVVMAVGRPGHCVLLHRKGWYEPGVFRLLSGGIDLDESVAATLARELEEETGLTLGTTCFLGVLDCHIHYDSREVPFASYVFYLPHTEGELKLPRGNAEDISEFRDVPIAELHAVAEDLRHVPPPRTGWGHWRAIAHDFVHERVGEMGA